MASVPRSNRGELRRSGHVLLLCILDYVLLSGAHTHLPALLMLDITTSLGLSISIYSLCIGVGCLIKAALTVLAAGPLMEHFGASRCAVATTGAVGLLLALIGLTPARSLFCVLLIALETVTAFAEQPNFVVLLSTHFDALASFATSTIASAFSIAGALLPLILSPIVASYGWRAAIAVAATSCVLLLPILHAQLKPGALLVGGAHAGCAPTRKVTSTNSATSPKPLATHSSDGAPSSAAAVTIARPGGAVPPLQLDAAPSPVAAPAFAGGTTAAAAYRSATFWALWLATFLHLLYGTLLSAHLTTALRTGAGRDVVSASAINSVQFGCAIFGKVASGVLLSLPSKHAERWVRWSLFLIAPLLLTASHFLLLDVHPEELSVDLAAGSRGNSSSSSGGLSAVLVFATSTPQLVAYAITVGVPYGLLFGTFQCLPARLFGRRDLPKIQSATYSAILIATALFGPLVGHLRDAYGGYQAPLCLTFVACCIEAALLVYLMRADARARTGASYRTLRDTV